MEELGKTRSIFLARAGQRYFRLEISFPGCNVRPLFPVVWKQLITGQGGHVLGEQSCVPSPSHTPPPPSGSPPPLLRTDPILHPPIYSSLTVPDPPNIKGNTTFEQRGSRQCTDGVQPLLQLQSCRAFDMFGFPR